MVHVFAAIGLSFQSRTTKFKTIAQAFLMGLAMAFGGCGAEAGALDECTSAPVGRCAHVQTCCNSETCYFLVDGQEFSCDAEKDCDAAVVNVKNHCAE